MVDCLFFICMQAALTVLSGLQKEKGGRYEAGVLYSRTWRGKVKGSHKPNTLHSPENDQSFKENVSNFKPSRNFRAVSSGLTDLGG